MRGVILAGGSGTRLAPLTRTVNKHLLPVAGVPMIYHPVRRLAGAGVRDVLVVTGVHHIGDIVNQLRSGAEFGCRFTYKVQDEPGGIAQALGLARDYARGQPICVALGDNIYQDPLGPALARYRGAGAMLLLKAVGDPRRFGVARFEGGRLAGVVEKPAAPPSRLAVTGTYLYDARVFDIIDDLTPSARGELEISDVNHRYIRDGEMDWVELSGWWSDAGTHDSLALADHLARGGAP